MRIAIFTESYDPIINGVSVFVRTLRDELSRRGHSVFVFAPGFKGYSDARDDVFRFPSKHTFFMPDYPFPIPFSRSLRKTFESLDLDIVHTQTPFLLGFAGARWARQCGVPLVSTNHTLYTEYAHYCPIRPKAITRLSLIKLMKWYYSGCDALVVPSGPVKHIIRSFGIKTPVEVIKTGIVGVPPVTTEERFRIREQFGIKDGQFLLLYVGRIAREKNLVMLLKAFRTVTDQHPSAKLILVGGGPALNETKQFASDLGLDDNLQFLGMLKRDKINPIYAAADAFVFPSTTETQGIAVCEALSAGLPVVAVNAGGVPENIRHEVDGFLTNDDPVEFADRISFLVTDEDKRREMGNNAREDSKDFSIERMVSDFEKFYISVIENSKPKPLKLKV